MRLVLDTNVVASGLLWGGTPARLLDAEQITFYQHRLLENAMQNHDVPTDQGAEERPAYVAHQA